MRNQDRAISCARRLFRKYKTRDPFAVAEEVGVQVLFEEGFKEQKGAFKVILKTPFIFLNPHLSEHMQRIVCAHELGHALLHRELGTQKQPLMEFEVMDIVNDAEMEANVFAAELMLDEEEIIDCIEQGWNMVSIARKMNTNVNLLSLKVIAMGQKKNQTKILSLPEMPRKGFLGSVSDSAADY